MCIPRLQCYYKFNDPFRGSTDEVLRDDAVARSYPLCGAEIEASMDAVKDTPTCINRGKTRNLNPRKIFYIKLKW